MKANILLVCILISTYCMFSGIEQENTLVSAISGLTSLVLVYSLYNIITSKPNQNNQEEDEKI